MLRILALSFFSLVVPSSNAFSPFSFSPVSTSLQKRLGNDVGPIYMAGFFDDVGKFFSDLGGGGSDDSEDDIPSNEQEMDYAGSTRVLTIPAKSIKPGGLRLFATFYMMGLQNTPEKGSWKANQADDTTIDMRYQDLSAMLMVRFLESEIVVDRLGSKPSMKYMMQESIVLSGFLDELKVIAEEGDLKESDRLLVLPEPGDALENARETLSFL